MNELNFRYCPVCSGLLEKGNLMIPEGRSVRDYVWWYSEKNVVIRQSDECVGLLWKIPFEYDIENFKMINIPAGYCKKCDRIFAEFKTGE